MNKSQMFDGFGIDIVYLHYVFRFVFIAGLLLKNGLIMIDEKVFYIFFIASLIFQ